MKTEIIEKLMKQSYKDKDSHNRIFSPEMFAELIIRECANVADCPSSFQHTTGYKIRRHFGIEQ